MRSKVGYRLTSSLQAVLRRQARQARPGFSLLELLLFLAIFSIFSVTLVSVFIATQDARIRQHGIAAVEQRGGELLQIHTRRIRRSEVVLWPTSGNASGVLALQMSHNEEFPTIFTQSGSNLLLIEKTAQSFVLNDRLTLSEFSVKNVADTSVLISFKLSIVLQLPTPRIYQRRFEAAVTLYPQDQHLAGGCGACPAPQCVSGNFQWYTCVNGSCIATADDIAC